MLRKWPVLGDDEQQLPRRLSIVVASVSLFSIALIIALGWWAMSTVDHGAEEREVTFARKGLQDSYARKEQESSTIWDEAVVKVKEGDQAWMQENMGEWMGSYFGHDHVFILDDKDTPVHAMNEGRTLSPESAYRDDRGAIEPLVNELRVQMRDASEGLADSTEAIAGLGVEDYALVEGRPAIVSVKPIIPSTEAVTQPPGTEYLHVSVRFLDQTFLDQIADQYQLAGATLVSGEQPSGRSIPIVNATGVTIAHLEWDPYRPGLGMVERMAPTIAIASVPVGAVLVLLLSHLWRSTRRLHFLAFHDSMTGLPNRALFNIQLRRALDDARRSRSKVAVMMLDLDRFKNVNDTLGHPAGDELIRHVGDRLQGSIEGSAALARLGGDEFALILAAVQSEKDAETCAERILAEMQRPFLLGDEQVVSSVSIGIATSDDQEASGSDLLRKADIALYEAKSKGRQRYQFFFRELSDIVLRKRAIEQDLRAALENGTLVAAYQPVFDTTGQNVVGAEALLRWQHPVHGALAPEVFIAIAEERGLIDDIGGRMLELVCQLLRETSLPWVALNVSPIELHHEGFAKEVVAALQEAGVDPRRLQIEIKESVLMESDVPADANLRRLRAAGIKIVLDDFGTGYSSLNYLRQYPVDKIKIDRSLISQVTMSSECDAIVEAIVSLAKSLKKTVAAQGVETRKQREQVAAMGFDEVQGFELSRPLAVMQMRSQFGELWETRGSQGNLAG